MSTSGSANEKPGRPAWVPVLDRIEQALADWVAQTVPPAETINASPTVPATPLGTLDERLRQIKTALERVGLAARDTDALLEQSALELTRWRLRATEVRRRLLERDAEAI